MLGGSSAINLLALIFPQKSSINAWAKLGNRNWNWNALAPYYSKFYTYNQPPAELKEALGTSYIKEEIQGRSGPIQASFSEFCGPLNDAWTKSFSNLNLPMSNDPVSGEGIGGFACFSALDPKTKERSHSGSAYYKPVAERPNLYVLTEAMVQRLYSKIPRLCPRQQAYSSNRRTRRKLER